MPDIRSRSLSLPARSADWLPFGRSADVVWDKHYHVVLASDRHTRNIIEEIGLGDEFRWVETKTGFYTDGELISMSDTMEFLKFPPLDLISKLRLGATIFYASKVKNWKRLEKITVEKWLTRLSGKQTFEKIWKPLLKAKLGEAYKETAASFIWATIQRMYSARNSGMKRDVRLRSRRICPCARTIRRGSTRKRRRGQVKFAHRNDREARKWQDPRGYSVGSPEQGY